MTLSEKRPTREELSCEDFEFFRRFIFTRTGITYSEEKKYLLEGKLSKHLGRWGFTTFGDFRRHITRNPDDSAALLNLGNAVSINKTDFFRDPSHFDFLQQSVLPRFSPNFGNSRDRSFAFKAWSAECATGKEPYTLAMVLQNFSEQDPAFTFSILATDLSTTALETAQRSLYPARSSRTDPCCAEKEILDA